MIDPFKSIWNYDMSAAPKSHYFTTTQVIGDKSRTVEKISVIKLLVAYDGDYVGSTRWLPDENRWEGFKVGEQPEAWMPYPKHPSLGDA